MSTALQEEIRQLSVAEKILLVEELWDQIAQNTDPQPLSESQRRELDRRYQEFLQNPREGSPWSEVKQRILGEWPYLSSSGRGLKRIWRRSSIPVEWKTGRPIREILCRPGDR